MKAEDIPPMLLGDLVEEHSWPEVLITIRARIRLDADRKYFTVDESLEPRWHSLDPRWHSLEPVVNIERATPEEPGIGSLVFSRGSLWIRLPSKITLALNNGVPTRGQWMCFDGWEALRFQVWEFVVFGEFRTDRPDYEVLHREK